MIREFNYTQRKRIEAQHVQIELLPPGDSGVHSFSAELNLGDLNLPDNAVVVVEAERDRVSRRYDWGNVGNPPPPASLELTDVPFPPNFRVMVLAPDDSRRILALNNSVKAKWDRISPREAAELVHVQEEDLGQEVWRLDFGGPDDIPVLKVNRNIEGMSNAVRSDRAFRALVFPEVMRTILTHMLLVEGADPEAEDRVWHSWFGFVSRFYPRECPSSSAYYPDDARKEEMQEWIDGAVEAFTQNRFNASDIYTGAGR
jgi:hypothetical protein